MRYSVIVKTGASRSALTQKGDTIHIAVKARPQNNKANFEVIKLLAKHFGKHIQIVSGFASKKKVIEVFD